MAEYTLKVRRFQPEAGEGPYWEELRRRARPDALGPRRAAPGQGPRGRLAGGALLLPRRDLRLLRDEDQRPVDLACKTQIGEAQEFAEPQRRNGDDGEPIVVEPMGNMPVIKDLVTDMESTHWTKIRRVTPWLLPEGDPPEREYVVPPESMIDITQSMACIQCGACVSSCLSMEADPDFIGPAALAKAYRFVGDPRDAETRERLHDLAQDPHGIYDCTHCFSLHRRLPEGRGADGPDHAPAPRRPTTRTSTTRTTATTTRRPSPRSSRRRGPSTRPLLLQESYAPGHQGQADAEARRDQGPARARSRPRSAASRTGKMRSLPKLIPGVHPKLPGDAQDQVKRIYAHAEEHQVELNLYITRRGGRRGRAASPRRPRSSRSPTRRGDE